MHGHFKSNKYCFCIVLIVLSLFFIQISYYTKGVVVKTPENFYSSDVDKLDHADKVTILNTNNYLITGETGEVHDPTTICFNEGDIGILWREEKSLLKIAKYDTNLSRIINTTIVVNGSMLTEEEYELSQPWMLKDSTDNLHIFWYMLGYDYPQQGDIYYMLMNASFQTIIEPKSIHTYTHGGNSSSAGKIIIKALMDEENLIHLILKDNSYYLLNKTGDIRASIKVPVETGEVQDLVVDNNEDVIVVCEGEDNFYSIKYSIEESSFVELNRNILFDISDEVIHYARLQRIGNSTFFYWSRYSLTTGTDYYESYALNTDGTLGEYEVLNANYFKGSSYTLDTKHAATVSINWELFADAELFFSYYHPTQNENYTEAKLIIRFVKNEGYFYGPAIFKPRIISDMESNFILLWYVNDGNNGFQVFIWKCNNNGEIYLPLVVVAPENMQITFPTPIISLPKAPLVIILVIIPIIIRKRQKRKRWFRK